VRPVPGRSLRLAVLLTILVASAVAGVVVHASGPGPRHILAGETEQDRGLRLELDDDGRAVAFATTVRSECKGGRSWTLDWAPAEGDAVFRQRGDRLVVQEVIERAEGDGRISRIGAVMTAQVGDERAGGEIRLVSRIHRGGQEVQACDSGPVRWAAGVQAEERLAEARPSRRPTDWYYPKVPSLAGEVSPERAVFIRDTDATCARTFVAARVAYEAVVAAAGDPARELAAYAAYVDAHAAQLRALEALGRPPDGAALHARWIGNMRERIRLERAVLRLAQAGEHERVAGIHRRIGELKMVGNEVGQRFGLQVCTSNGPDRTPVPR
jgi:hypothetical protein